VIWTERYVGMVILSLFVADHHTRASRPAVSVP
jgi:hypothetical protein